MGNSGTKPENKPVGSANAVTADDLDGNSFWVVEEEEPHAHADCAVPSPLSDDSDLDSEWDDFHTELESMEGHSDWLDSEDEEVNIGGTAAAVIAPVEVDTTPHVELYDSGASQHISPYKADFSSYTTLSQPHYLNAANQNRFPTIGMGTLVVCAPNNAHESELVLHNVLHAPSIGYTLVSLGALDEEGYTSHIAGGRLRITSPHGEQITDIARTCHLY